MALWVAPVVEVYLISSRQIMAFLCAYTVGSVPLTAWLLWSPMHEPEPGYGPQCFWNVLRANAGRVGGMLTLLVLVMLAARGGAEAWAGRLSALPLPQRPVSSMVVGVLGLLILWGVCGLTIWGTLGGVVRLEHRTREGERSTPSH